MEVKLKISDEKYAEIEKFCAKNGMVLNHFLANAMITEMELQKKIRTIRNKAIRELANEAVAADNPTKAEVPNLGVKKADIGQLKRKVVLWLLEFYESKYKKKMILNKAAIGHLGLVAEKLLSVDNDDMTNKALFTRVLTNAYADDFIKKEHLNPHFLHTSLNKLNNTPQQQQTQTDYTKPQRL